MRRDAQPEVLDPPARQPARRDVVGALVVDDDTHVGEARQHVGERRLRARAVELEVGVLLVARREAHRERAFRVERLQQHEVGERLGRVEVVPVRGGERVAPDAQQVEPGLFAARRRERVAEVVDPRPRRRRDCALRARRRRRQRVARIDVQHEVQAREHRLAEARVPLVAPRRNASVRIAAICARTGVV